MTHPPADILPRIFDPCFATKGRDQGTGLGLAVSHGLAIDNEGELSVARADRGQTEEESGVLAPPSLD